MSKELIIQESRKRTRKNDDGRDNVLSIVICEFHFSSFRSTI